MSSFCRSSSNHCHRALSVRPCGRCSLTEQLVCRRFVSVSFHRRNCFADFGRAVWKFGTTESERNRRLRSCNATDLTLSSSRNGESVRLQAKRSAHHPSGSTSTAERGNRTFNFASAERARVRATRSQRILLHRRDKSASIRDASAVRYREMKHSANNFVHRTGVSIPATIFFRRDGTNGAILWFNLQQRFVQRPSTPSLGLSGEFVSLAPNRSRLRRTNQLLNPSSSRRESLGKRCIVEFYHPAATIVLDRQIEFRQNQRSISLGCSIGRYVGEDARLSGESCSSAPLALSSDRTRRLA